MQCDQGEPTECPLPQRAFGLWLAIRDEGRVIVVRAHR
jgi:hypothetical protein